VTFVDISAMRAVFAWTFAKLLSKKIYTLVTELCRFNQDNPHFSAFEHHEELRELTRVN